MTFSETLVYYLSQYRITISELSAETGISKSMLSRMKNGRKEPAADSELLELLAKGIAVFAARCGDTDTDPDTVKEMLGKSLHPEERFDLGHIVNNLNHLIASLDFRVSDLSRYLNFDASYLSLIRSGKRNPSDIAAFCAGIADFVALRYDAEPALLASVLGCHPNELLEPHARRDSVYKWLTEHAPQADRSTLHFLKKLDAFDLNEFIGAIQFEESAIPLQTAQPPLQKNYYTPDGFMQAELDWLNTVIASPGTHPVLFYSDMPFEEISKSAEFSKQWMLGLALLLKKGIHLTMIHQLDRQDAEMMLGLEAWIPLYMTGQVSPYYLKNNKRLYFHHFLRVSDAAVLSGEAIAGYYEDGRYHFSRSREELAYYQKRGEQLLTRAQPLMEIYRRENASEYQSFFDSQYQKSGRLHRNLLSAPPLYTISPELLADILAKNHAPQEDIQKITAYAEEYRQWAQNLLCEAALMDELFEISEADFREYPVSLPLSDLFLEQEYLYDYEDYLTHLRQTKDFANRYSGYRVFLNRSTGFRNIQIRMAEGDFVIISKEKCPTIHFVIRHPKLRNAIEHLAIPIVEKRE